VRGQVRRSVRRRFSVCTRRDQPVQRVDVVARLREINLTKELDDFETVSRFLVRAWAQRSRSGEQFWLVIALAKCDLYETAAARRYYDPDSADEPTEFSRIVADLRADIPTLIVAGSTCTAHSSSVSSPPPRSWWLASSSWARIR
jgi:hypothetical protein